MSAIITANSAAFGAAFHLGAQAFSGLCSLSSLAYSSDESIGLALEMNMNAPLLPFFGSDPAHSAGRTFQRRISCVADSMTFLKLPR